MMDILGNLKSFSSLTYCYFVLGVSTTKDCYDSYISDSENAVTEDRRQFDKILIVPVYYIIMSSSCQFGPSDINESSEYDKIILKGTIIDLNIANRIRLASVHR